MRGLKIGLGIGAQRLGSGGGGPTNLAAPRIDETSNGYAGGPYLLTEGQWSSGNPILTLETSTTGGAPWTNQGEYALNGDWPAAWEALYVRVREEVSGVFAYSATFGPLGVAYDRVVDFSGNDNYLSHTVTAPFIGADLGAATTGASEKGFWFAAEWYYNGSGYEQYSDLISLGNAAAGNVQASLNPAGTDPWRDGGGGGAVGPLPAVAAAGWYLTTGYYYNFAGGHGSTVRVNNSSGTSTNTGNGELSLTSFTTLRIGDRAWNTPDSAQNFDQRMSYVAFGRGNPVDAHAWAYNSGQLRRMDGYDFAGDLKCTIDGFILLSRKGAATFANTDVVDSIGGFDSWTYTGSGITWATDQPGFIDPTAPPPATPSTYIFPRYADTDDANLTLCINTKDIGTAVGGDFTISSLTHSVAGNIAGTVTGDTFPNPGAGTITGTINGVSVACEIVTPLAMPAYKPAFADRYSGNARVAAIENYPTYGAGTTYGSIAAMKAGIDALGSGATLTIENLTAAGTLTLTAKDYGGATIQARFRHGIVITTLDMTGVTNLTIRGFKTTGLIAGSAGVSGVVVDHCTGAGFQAFGTTGTTETVTLSNWCGPDDGTEEQLTFNKLDRATIHRVAHARVDNDILRTDNCNTVMVQRCFLGDTPNSNPDAHLDAWQMYLSGAQGFTGGLALNVITTDVQESGETAAQGITTTVLTNRHMRFKKCAIRSSLTTSLGINADQGCSFQDVMVSQNINNGASSYSMIADNIVKGSAGTVLPAGAGPETNVLASVTMTTAYPQWVSHVGTWEQWDNPAGGYTTAGAYALIDELAANKASYP